MSKILYLFLTCICTGTLTQKDREPVPIDDQEDPDPDHNPGLTPALTPEEWADHQKKLQERYQKGKREEVPYEKIYIPNPRLQFDPRYHSDEKIVRNNVKWLEEIHYNPGQSKFITKMINMIDTIPFTPYFAATQVDPTPYCWVMLFYNSDQMDGREGIYQLLKGLSEYYYERCGVSSVDIGYPTNAAMFQNLKEETFPLLLVKKPLKANKMFVPESLKIRPTDRAEGHFKVMPIDTWGKLISNRDLVEHPTETFKDITEIYAESSANIKVAALLMEHYHEVNKGMLEHLLDDMMVQVREYAVDQVIEKGFEMSHEVNGKEDLTPAEIEKHDLAYAQQFAAEMEHVYADEKTISFRYLINEALKLAHHSNPDIRTRMNLNPIPHPDIASTFKQWHSEL